MHELPLVFFTVFTQSAVGAFILLLIGGAMGLIEPRRMAIGLFSVMCLFHSATTIPTVTSDPSGTLLKSYSDKF